MLVNRSAAPGPVAPSLVYENVGKAVDWLCQTFGFTERFRYGPEGSPAGAQLAVGTGSVFLIGARTSEDMTFRPPRPQEATHSIHVQIENVDNHYERAMRHNARIVSLPQTYAFGERQYTVQDPEGHCWTFSQTVADVAPEDWGGMSANL